MCPSVTPVQLYLTLSILLYKATITKLPRVRLGLSKSEFFFLLDQD